MMDGVRRKLIIVAAALLMVGGGVNNVKAEPFFMGLGDLPGGSFESFGFAVSADGAVVVGRGQSASGIEAFRWTESDGMVGLGDLPGGAFQSLAFGVSADGTVVVGQSDSASSSASGSEAFRWEAGTMTALGAFLPAGPLGGFFSRATGVSADGTVLVGQSRQASGFEAFRWEAGTMTGLGALLPAGSFGFFSRATGISADGAVIVGATNSASGSEAFRWEAGTMTGLGVLLSNAGFSSVANGISADGAVVVGVSSSASGSQAFRWEAGTVTGLDDLPGGTFSSTANAVSADGSVIVGQSESAAGNEAFIWDETNEMRSLKSVLETDFGLNLTGWTLETATGTSSDGLTIVGTGINPLGETEAWIANLANDIPIADGGVFQRVPVSSAVVLNASNSFDPDGNVPLTFEWTLLSQPFGSTATLSNPTAATPSLTLDVPGEYFLELVVTDSLGAVSNPDTVIVATLPDPSTFGFGENAGWVNSTPLGGIVPGIDVGDSDLVGFLWGENLGWINLSCANTSSCGTVDYNVSNDSNGNLAGYAWAENGGWVSFSCTNTNSCATANYGVTINPDTGKFGGKAWSENRGWISFGSTGATFFEVTTDWRPPAGSTPTGMNVMVMPEDPITNTMVDVTYSDVTQPGSTDLTTSDTGPPAPPSSMGGTTTTYYDLSTTADVTGPIEVCVTYTPTDFISAEEHLRLYHYEGVEPDAVWVDRTVGDPPVVDTENDIICASVESLDGEFAVFEPNHQAPIANAGLDQIAQRGELVALDGTGSTDPDGGPLSYLWTLTPANGSAAILTGGDTATPSFTPDVLGAYTIRLVVTDSFGATHADEVIVTVDNAPPIADAGDDQTVRPRASVTLDGTASSDPEGDTPLTFSWVLIAAPLGHDATIVDSTLSTASLDLGLVQGDFTVQLIVTDSLGAVSVPDTVIISTENSAPVADAGLDQVIQVIGATVQLDGSQSFDNDGDALTYQWSMTSKPVGSTATLSDATAVTPTFVADANGTYEMSLVVTDEFGAVSDLSTVVVSFLNVAPIAEAGDAQTAPIGTLITLDGSGSSDANGDPFTYSWSITAKPATSGAVLDDVASVTPTFTLDQPGIYTITLVVNDGFVDSAADAVVVSATLNPGAVIAKLSEVIDTVNVELVQGDFKNRTMQDTLGTKFNVVIAKVNEGELEDALDKLKRDIKKKVDGCHVGGAPDKNDWVKDCAAQAQVYPIIVDAIALIQALLP